MRPDHDFRRAASAAALLLLTLALPASGTAQMDPNNVPSPPAELARLEPFFGTFRHTNQMWAGVGPFNGTVDVHPTVKGWYVELVIDTRSGPIDRELRMLTTYDEELGHYRVWRFETLPQSPTGTVEAEAWFEGDDFVMDWRDSRGPDGHPGVFRNRVRMDGNDLVIDSEVDPDWQDVIHLGTWRSTRVEKR